MLGKESDSPIWQVRIQVFFKGMRTCDASEAREIFFSHPYKIARTPFELRTLHRTFYWIKRIRFKQYVWIALILYLALYTGMINIIMALLRYVIYWPPFFYQTGYVTR